MTPDPSGDPQEQEIWLRALREYSEECEAPQLTVGCPYRLVDDSIGPWCLDECVDLLAAYNAPPPISEETTVGDMSIVRGRRPRTRRNLVAGPRAFDAREQYLADEAMALTQRRTVSLVYAINLRLGAPRVSRVDFDDEASDVDVSAIVAELARRGYDVELLIRDGMSQDIAMAILWSVLIPRMASEDDDHPITIDPSIAPWDAILVEEVPDQPIMLLQRTLRHGAAIEDWVRTAPFDDVLEWRAPEPPVIQSFTGPVPTRGPHRWMADRILKTYLRDWETESLKLEWQYHVGKVMPPCPSAEMSVRRIDGGELASMLADRVALDTNKTPTALHRFTDIAVDLLRDGKRASAAAIFQAIVEAEPDHAEAQNNLGFCLLPDDPQRALFALQRAAELAATSRLTIAPNIGNRILAFALLGRLTPALELAERFHEESGPTGGGNGWMWDTGLLSRKDPVLLDVDVMGRYIVELAYAVAIASGEERFVTLWGGRMTPATESGLGHEVSEPM